MAEEKTKEENLQKEVEVAEEVKEPPPPDVVQLCRETFQKSAEYLHGELEGTIEDYKLLETLNKITITKYTDMKEFTENISRGLQELNEKYSNLHPFLEQINQIDENVTALEQAAYKLDNYSKRLESKFKALEKR
ncbi:biogenesis of lysosome-related organelles complex 1 subunit 2-like isoform X2 [Crassostrea angulata]|uniref:Biogenesis of lysosome-related organelles complex 1 subunit 2 n=1 Tax=Magallana gigas TaxID=29159 RepID=A0A8W8HSF0_MAGGI|nr:biogenesis of lysosome-related organelles complex 1 subunit 2 [Crassostrea gigas]XP_052686164.1 biogenesis of lysosome-related organelles complex 1 subunit 2-like isoform X2 [Crassostrea angulata]|eukprot:XP_011454403.1 PREDICTED: biogenesis of lysosome-related organelles complex 1 subunit 2-like [Crassostrea gigas]